MVTRTLSVPRGGFIQEGGAGSRSDDRAEFAEAPESRGHEARGVLTGVLLGAGLWGVILVLLGVIKL